MVSTRLAGTPELAELATGLGADIPSLARRLDGAEFAYFPVRTRRAPLHAAGFDPAQRTAWLLRYCQQRQLPGSALMRQNIEVKVRRIARHDAGAL